MMLHRISGTCNTRKHTQTLPLNHCRVCVFLWMCVCVFLPISNPPYIQSHTERVFELWKFAQTHAIPKRKVTRPMQPFLLFHFAHRSLPTPSDGSLNVCLLLIIWLILADAMRVWCVCLCCMRWTCLPCRVSFRQQHTSSGQNTTFTRVFKIYYRRYSTHAQNAPDIECNAVLWQTQTAPKEWVESKMCDSYCEIKRKHRMGNICAFRL